MEGIMVSASTGVMNSLLTKLTTLLGEKYKLQKKVKRDVAFVKNELSIMNVLLETLADTKVLDPQQKLWRNEVREMAYDIEEYIDCYMLQLHQVSYKSNGIKEFFSEMVKKVKKLKGCHGIAIRELKTRIVEARQRRDKYAALYAEASSPVGTDVPNRPTPSFGTCEEDKIGLWGANTGTLHDIEGVRGRLKSVTIRSGEVINSLALELLEKVTGGFSEENKIGSGGYGKVYKGVLNGKEIAVKKLHDHQAFDDVIFKNEFENLMRVQHQNIVELVGYCNETRHTYVEHDGRTVCAEIVDRVLCFEYLQNGSLDEHLYEEHHGLDWCTRYKIIKGICEGLNCLHGLEESILHLDLKPANILLDENMVPKIADFGLSRLFGETHTHITKNLTGTGMYMPPEFITEGIITKKYDVFSLGVIIIQIMTGPKGFSKYWEMSSQQFIELVHQNWKVRVEAEATSMHTLAGEDCKQVKRCIEIALNCVKPERQKRPTIGDIIHKLREKQKL